MSDKLIMGYVISGQSFLLIVLSMLLGAVWHQRQGYLRVAIIMGQQIKDMLDGAIKKEKRITALKAEVKGYEQLMTLKDEELNDMEEKYQLAMQAAAAFQANAEAKTPEWYKAALLEKIAQVKNLTMLNTLLEDANALYAADIKQLQQERDTLANKIDKLREEYNAYQNEAIGMPDIMPIAGQTGVIIDEKPMAEPYESEINDGQTTPADEHDVAVGC